MIGETVEEFEARTGLKMRMPEPAPGYEWRLFSGRGAPHYALDPAANASDPFYITEIPYDPLMGPRDYAAAKPAAEPVKAGSYKVKDRSGSSLGIAKVLADVTFGPVRYRLAGQSAVHEITIDEWNQMSPEPSRWA